MLFGRPAFSRGGGAGGVIHKFAVGHSGRQTQGGGGFPWEDQKMTLRRGQSGAEGDTSECEGPGLAWV